MSDIFVPVVDAEHQPLMPTTPARARRWIKGGKATAFWKGGLFCVWLNLEPSSRQIQRVAVGMDPGFKKEALVVASAAHTYLNLQADAREGVKEAEKRSTQMRRSRRSRHTPCRKMRQNRKQSKRKLPPSTRARGPWKLRLARWLCCLFPVAVFVVEDIKASTKPNKRRWNSSFSRSRWASSGSTPNSRNSHPFRPGRATRQKHSASSWASRKRARSWLRCGMPIVSMPTWAARWMAN